MIFNFDHLKDTKNSYFSHMRFALPEAVRAFGISIIMLIHSIFPFLLWNGNFDQYIRKALNRLDEDQRRWKDGA